MYTQILQNLKKIHTKAKNDKKSNILLIVAYDNMRNYEILDLNFQINNLEMQKTKEKITI